MCELDTNEEGAVMSRCGFSGSLVPRLSPASIMSSLKFAGSKVTMLLLCWLRTFPECLLFQVEVAKTLWDQG